MPHRQHLRSSRAHQPESGLWSQHATRDLEVAIGFLRESALLRTSSVEHSAAVLGALISYSRPFTERPDPALNQTPGQRRCFLDIAADLSADLRRHARLGQARDDLIALSEIVRAPAQRVNARRFKYPDPRCARITRSLNYRKFNELATAMRLACVFFQIEIDRRGGRSGALALGERE